MAQRSFGDGVSFLGMVGGVMAFLKLKSKYDEYTQVSGTEEGRIALTSPSVDNVHGEGNDVMLDTQIPSSSKRAKRKRACCMCCGIDCSLLWKAIAIVLGLYTLYYGFRAVKWASTPAPTGLEGMPELDISLGCVGAQYIYNETEVLKTVSLGYRGEHDFNVRGVSVGTVTMIDGDPDATEIEYRITVRSDRKDTLDHVQFIARDDQKDKFAMSQFILDTTHAPSAESKPYCMRFDVNMYVPPNLKKLSVYSDPDAHVSFVPGTQLANVEHLEITLEGSSTNNIIRPIPDVLAKKVTLKASGGWIVGEATVVNQFQVSTELGDAVANLKITHSIPVGSANPEKVSVESIIGSGRADVTIIGRKALKRKIVDMHTSTGGGDMYLTYKDAEYNGKIQLYSKSYTTSGAHKFNPPKEHHEGAEDHIPKWTHFVGDPDGGDELYVTSLGKGWAKLYF